MDFGFLRRGWWAPAAILCLLHLSGCSGCSDKKRERAVELEFAIPLTAEQAAALEGIRAGVRGGRRAEDPQWADELSRAEGVAAVEDVSTADEALRGAVAGIRLDDQSAAEGIRGQVVSGVRGGIRAATSGSGRRGAPDRDPASREPVNQADPSGSQAYGVTGSRIQASHEKRATSDDPAFAFQFTAPIPEKSLAPGERRLRIVISPPEEPDLSLVDVQMPLIVSKDKRGLVIDEQEIPPEIVQLPDGDEDGVSTLIETITAGPEYARDPQKKPSVDLTRGMMVLLGKNLGQTLQTEQGITVEVSIDPQGITLTPPETAATSIPAEPGTPAAALPAGVTITGIPITFTFSCTGTSACKFACSIDGGPYFGCTSPFTWKFDSPGEHLVKIKSADNIGNTDTSPVDLIVNVITPDQAADPEAVKQFDLPPNTLILEKPPSATSSASATFTFTSSESNSTFECALDSAPFTSCTSPLTLSLLTQGSHIFRVRAIDAAGQVDASPATVTWTIDPSAPVSPGAFDTTITGQPSATSGFTSATFSFTSTLATAAFECSLDSAPFAPCTSPLTLSPLTQGSHTFRVRAVDSSGSRDPTPASYTWTVDLTVLDTTITNQPAAIIGQPSATFAFTSSNSSATFECDLDGGGFSSCASPKTYAGLTSGSHTFKVRAKDSSGNSDPSPAAFTFTVDVSPPTFAGLASAAAVSTSQIDLAWAAATDNVSPSSTLVYEICQSTTSGTCTTTFTATYTTVAGATSQSVTGLSASATYFFVARAKDELGNRDTNSVEKSATTLGGPPPAGGNVQAITAGGYHTCALASDGTSKCWGYNSYGQLGDGTTANRLTPNTVPALSSTILLNGGNAHSCSLTADGTARCWGLNNYGQIGDGTLVQKTTPVGVSTLTGVVTLAGGKEHTCALLFDGTVRCWGNDTNGQLGDGTSANQKTTPVAVSTLTGAVAITAGLGQSCALLSDGTVRCWGLNSSGEVGDGTTAQKTTPVAVSTLTGAVAVAAGDQHVCALVSDGTVRCWGNNFSGQIGDGTPTNRPTPVAVSTLAGVTAMTGGLGHTCALISDGSARCWGGNSYGQIGDGTTANKSTPVAASTIAGTAAITGGAYHTCASVSDGSVRCWGYNLYGQIGDGTTVNRPIPVAVGGLTGSLGVKLARLHEATAAGAPARPWREGIVAGYIHSCALLSDGTVKCWGGNGNGQLGDGSTTNKSTPTIVPALTGATSLTAGDYYTCSLISDGSARCWGRNDFGQLGDGSSAQKTSPVAISTLTGAVALTGGTSHTCSLHSDGAIRCWGKNDVGQLGDGTTANKSTPVTVSTLTGAIAVTSGFAHSCALLADGTVRCWGRGTSGQLGDGTTVNKSTPVSVSTLTGAVAVAVGDYHTCALSADGGVKCWGYNAFGQIGDGSGSDRWTPVAASTLTNAFAVTAGSNHACALLANGTVRCWGYNIFGQLGDGSTADKPTSVAVSTLTGAVAVTGGASHTCAAVSDGTARCWGAGGSGQLGDGGTANRPTAVQVTGLP